MGAAGARTVAMLAAVALVAFVASRRERSPSDLVEIALAGSQDERAVTGNCHCVLRVSAS